MCQDFWGNFGRPNPIQILTMSAIKLRIVPEDVMKFILKKQGEIKEKKCIGLYSQENVVYQIIKEHPDFQQPKKQKKDATNS